MIIDNELRELDFSSLSKIKDSLFTKLIEDRARRVELEEDDLDFLAAAGNNFRRNDSDKDLK